MSTLLVRNKYDFVEFFTERVNMKKFLDNRLNDLYIEVCNITTLINTFHGTLYLLNAVASHTPKYLTFNCNDLELDRVDSSRSSRVKVHVKRKPDNGFLFDLRCVQHCITHCIRDI